MVYQQPVFADLSDEMRQLLVENAVVMQVFVLRKV